MRKGSSCMTPVLRRPRALQQSELVADAWRAPERRRLERRQPAVETQPPRADVEQCRDLIAVLALPALAVEEARIGDPSGARIADAGEHALAPLGVVLGEPRVEELVERLREPHEVPARARRAGARPRLEET